MSADANERIERTSTSNTSNAGATSCVARVIALLQRENRLR
jgi:hypothetical protein